jgi:hypothetical protein
MTTARRRRPITSAWALAYLLMSLQLLVHLPSGDVDWTLALGAVWFTPMLGFWLGARFGRAALTPLVIASALSLPGWYVDMSAVKIEAMLVPELAVVCAVATLAGARYQQGPWAMESTVRRQLIGALLIALLAGEAGVSFQMEYAGAGLRWIGPEAVAAAAFCLVLCGWMAPAWATAAVALTAAAGFALRAVVSTSVSTDMDIGYSGYVRASAEWVDRPEGVLWMGVAAVLAALFLRRVWSETTGGDKQLDTPWLGLGAVAAAMALPLLPLAISTLSAASDGQLTMMQAGDDGVREVIVTADRRYEPAGFLPYVNAIVLMGAVAFGFARRRSMGGPTRIALTSEAGLLVSIVFSSLILAMDDTWRAPTLLLDRFDLVAGVGAAVFVYAWFGSMAARRSLGRRAP